MKKSIAELKSLYEEARNRVEFEFVLTLINYRGIGKEDVTNLYEWFDAIDFYKRLYQSLEGKEKTRIGTLLYSTFFENSDFYNILGSLCKISLGYKGSSYLYYKTRKMDRLLATGEKIDLISELLNDSGKVEILKFFSENHFKQIRNTFFHSAYSLWETNYILQDTEAIVIDGVGKFGFDVNTFLYLKIDNVIAFFDCFKTLYFESFQLYKEDKEVFALFPGPTMATILGSENGLKGVEVKNTAQFYGQWVNSGIYYDEAWGMWVARNIQMPFENKETIDLDDQLKRYETKADIKNNSELWQLVDTVVDRRRTNELDRAIRILVKFGRAKYDFMKAQENVHYQRALVKQVIPFYQRAVDIATPEYDMSQVIARIKELQDGN